MFIYPQHATSGGLFSHQGFQAHFVLDNSSGSTADPKAAILR
jgi:hypothetical protein